jgi:hypothetical protein
MAGLAIPLVEAAALRVLAALGVGVAAGVATDAARRAAQERSAEAERASATPLARADTCAAAAGAQHPACKTCPPVAGSPTYRNTSNWSDITIAYQTRIGGMPPAPPGHITEWMYNGVTFDGFDPSQCLLKEAKARYDQFFDEFDRPRVWWQEGRADLVAEFERQSAAAVPRPPVRLRWHFMQPVSYRFFRRLFAAAHPDVEVVHLP